VVERDTLLWVWMGDAALAADHPAPNLSAYLDGTSSPLVHGYYQAHANYEVVTDNLMDLSHGVYLHPNTLSSDQAQVKKLKIELKQDGNKVSALHSYRGTPPTPLFKPFWTSKDELCDQFLDMHWSPPGTLLLDVGNFEQGKSHDTGPWLHSAHILTPISEFETHYFFVATRNFATDSEAVSKGLIDHILYAFTQEDSPTRHRSACGA
jgi:phenylpropionate dioxygenase-like ring-hydroxylating dioxygenase large terminal subunit